MAFRYVTIRRTQAEAGAGAQARNDLQQVAALLQRVGITEATGHTNATAIEHQHIEASFMQHEGQLPPVPLSGSAAGCVWECVEATLTRLWIDDIRGVGRVIDRSDPVATSATHDDE